jgi:hypothetical protein
VIKFNNRLISVIIISGLLTSVGKTSWEALISKEPTKIVAKLSVNSICNRIYKKRNYKPNKANSGTLCFGDRTDKK